MPSHDYRTQNLRGRSFAGQDLTGADFSEADLRGVDFSGATLSGAKFCRARLGRTLKMTGWIVSLQWLLSIMAGSLAALGSFFMLSATQAILKAVHSDSDANQIIFLGVYSLGFVFAFFISVMRQQWAYLLAFCSMIVLAAIAGAGALDLAVAVAVAVVVVVAVAVAGVVAVAVAGGLAIAIAVAVAVAGAGAGTGTGAVAVAVAVFVIFGAYLGYRASNKEEPQLLFLRHLGLSLNALGSTQFAKATLSDCDFSDADLKHARFNNATLQRCKFKHAKNAHLALTRNTPLEFKKVRELVVNGRLIDDDFKGLNLQGLDFSALDLQSVNFASCNLSFADFNHADLRGADLTETTALGTRFSHCQLTGACIGHWNIDSRTQLDGIDCQFVYLKKTDPSERNPLTGEFIAGEFSKLYQQIADTLDFVAHNRNQYEAIITAINTIKEQGCEGLYVQNVERKDEAIVIRAKVPPEFDRNAVYTHIQQESLVPIRLLETRHKRALLEKDISYLERESALKTKHEDLLAEVLKKTVSLPVTVHNEVGTIMYDQSRNIINSPTTNGAINLGDNSTVTASIAALPDASGELKALLLELQQVIATSAMKDDDKQQAGQQVNQLAAAAADNPLENQPAVVKNFSRWFKGFVDDIKDLPETAVKLGETVAKIVLLVGL